MPQTTVAVNACDSVIRLDDNAGALRDISGESNSFDLTFENAIGDFKTFASKWKGRIPCGRDAKIKIKGVYSDSATELKAMLHNWFFVQGGRRTLQIDVPDSSAGSDRFQCEAVLETYSVPGPADEPKPIMMEISLLPDGELTYVTI